MNKAKLKLELKLFIRKSLVYFLVFGSVALLSWITNKWIEGVLFIMAHTIIRQKFDKQYHTIMRYCIPLSITVFYYVILTAIPCNISILSSIIIAFIVSWIGYVVKDRADLMIICNKEKLFREDCNKAGLSKSYTDFAVDWKINGLTEKELLIKYNDQISSLDSVKTRKRRINKALTTI